MDKVRKNIILSEIKYWKEHRLLPEQYCNFLISLYTEGSEEEQQLYEQKPYSYRRFILTSFYVYIILQLVITLIVIYFTEIPIDLQMSLYAVFVITSFSSSFYFYKKKHPFFHIALIVGVLILFLASVHLISYTYTEGGIVLLMTILLNCILWVIVGHQLHLKYMALSGITGALLVIAYHFV